MRIAALTTVDNPHDYFTEPDEWSGHELRTGSRVYKMLGEFVHTSSDISDAQNAKEVERAIDDIIRYDPLNIYKKVVIEVPDP